jgi:hypothetical protein
VTLEYLGNIIGGRPYLGQFPCVVQHMSTHDRVARHPQYQFVILCAKCAVKDGAK